MKKIGIIGQDFLLPFWQSLSLSTEFVVADWKSLQSDHQVDGVYIRPEDGHLLFPDLKIIPRETLMLKYFDFLERTIKGFRPISVLREKGLHLIRRHTESLDVRKKVYVSGCDVWARELCHLTIQLGYQEIAVISPEKNDLSQEIQSFCRDLKSLAFGVHFYELPEKELTMQANDGSLLINTLLPTEYEELVHDLSYLNFLSPQGLVIDINAGKESNLLIEEAKHTGVRYIDGHSLRAHIEYEVLLRNAGLSSCSLEQYQEKRKSFLVNS